MYLFLQNFDPNQYRSHFERMLSNSFGIEVSMGDLSLGWQGNGIGIQIKDVSARREGGMKPFFSTASFFLKLNPFDLFMGRIIIYDFGLKSPRVFLLRQKDGSINWVSKFKKASFQISKKKWSDKMISGLAILFSRATISNGNFFFRDETSTSPMEFAVKDIEAELKHQAGVVKSTGSGMIFDESERNAEWTSLWKMMNQELELQLKFRGEELEINGKFLPFQKPPRYQGSLKLDHFVQEKGPLTGTIDGGGDWEGTGQDVEEIKKLLAGKGTIEIKDGAFKDINLVRSVLARITVIPGLQDAMLDQVPSVFQSLFSETKIEE